MASSPEDEMDPCFIGGSLVSGYAGAQEYSTVNMGNGEREVKGENRYEN